MPKMNRFFFSTVMLLLSLGCFAQEKINSFFFDTRATFHQEVSDGDYVSQFRGDHLNIHILGNISPTVNYRFRHSFSKKQYDENNLLNATDILYFNWKPDDHWSFLFGKYAVLIGGYEYDAAPIDVYFYSLFCSKIYQGFTFGGSATYHFNEKQSVVAQICNSPLSMGISGIYAYNLAWNGHITPWWSTIWSVNLVEDSRNKFINYISLGNHFSNEHVMLDLDIMNRAAIGQKNFLFSDMSIISKFIWSIGDWNICAKAGYEWNEASNVDSAGEAYDVVIAPGTEYAYGGCGLEWFPMGRDKVRLHAVYYRDNSLRKNNIEIGLTWKIRVI